jgi:hypothetical protein
VAFRDVVKQEGKNMKDKNDEFGNYLRNKTRKRCENCLYWDSEKLECHRYPPKQHTENRYGEIISWPSAKANDWCGEYKGQPSLTKGVK